MGESRVQQDGTLGGPAARGRLWQMLEGGGEWDLLVVGGGITGAGILREAARRGLRALLVEQRDFAWGTSSRSSKMVHGGLRYIAAGDFRLTREAARERERFLREAPGLVEPMRYVFAHRKGHAPGPLSMRLLLALYDLVAGRRTRRSLDAETLLWEMPYLAETGLRGGSQYQDAVTDDARLVLRTLQEALVDGARAINYVAAEQPVFHDGRVAGMQLRDAETGRTAELRARAVINATGAWSDRLRHAVVEDTRIRPLRGSHLVFPAWRLPVYQCLTLLHPEDQRPIFIYPWEGCTVVGTTDLDHPGDLDAEATITDEELRYLMRCVEREFPSLGITPRDIQATFSGVRPVIGRGAEDPSSEKRDHSVWLDDGLITVSGGKLTTFRLIAQDVLAAARAAIPEMPAADDQARVYPAVPLPAARGPIGVAQARRLAGYYGRHAQALLDAAGPTDLERVPGTLTLWAELRWAARTEAVVHLDDLLLRRTRVGLLTPCGATGYLNPIREMCQAELGWDDQRWANEAARYSDLWVRHYSLPEAAAAESTQAAAVMP